MFPVDTKDFKHRTKKELIELFYNSDIMFNKIDDNNLLLYVKRIRNGNMQLGFFGHIRNKNEIRRKIKLCEEVVNDFIDVYFEFNETSYFIDDSENADDEKNKKKSSKSKEKKNNKKDIDDKKLIINLN